jgi:hypothetical protein
VLFPAHPAPFYRATEFASPAMSYRRIEGLALCVSRSGPITRELMWQRDAASEI